MSLQNKVAIVTGGNSGIGQAIVLELARLGAKIVIDYVVRPEATEALEQQISKLGDQSIGIDADVSQVADLQKLADAAVAKFGRLDIMINNAGVGTRTSVTVKKGRQTLVDRLNQVIEGLKASGEIDKFSRASQSADLDGPS
jgi:glucose 1-dehydrogenase